MILAVAIAIASPRAAGDAAEDAQDYAAALAVWRGCAAGADARDARYCSARLDLLAPQETDAFAGWTVLEAVRRDYRSLGADAARARIQAELTARPASPAAPSMRIWLANEHARRGDASTLRALEADIRADPRSTEADRAFVATRIDTEAQTMARGRTATIGGGFAAIYLACALRGPGPLRWRPAALAALMLGVIPGIFAALYEEGLAESFLKSGGAMATAVLLAGRAPRWISMPGTAGAFALVAWGNDWYPSLGCG